MQNPIEAAKNAPIANPAELPAAETRLREAMNALETATARYNNLYSARIAEEGSDITDLLNMDELPEVPAAELEAGEVMDAARAECNEARTAYVKARYGLENGYNPITLAQDDPYNGYTA